jgi:hypothetical protein
VLLLSAMDRYHIVSQFKQRERVVIIDPAGIYYPESAWRTSVRRKSGSVNSRLVGKWGSPETLRSIVT